MADFGIKPDLPLQAVPQKRTSISDLLGTATKAMEFSRLSELYPELIKKTTAEAKTAEIGAEKAAMGLTADKASKITAGTVSLMFNPLVVAAAQGQPVDKNAFTNLVVQNVMTQSKNAGIDYEKEGKKIAAEYLAEAENNPAGFQRYVYQRMMEDLDKATRANMMTPEVLTTGFPVPVQRTRAEGVIRPLPLAEEPVATPSGQPAGQPSAMAAPAPSQRDVIAGQLTQPMGQVGNPGFPLNFAPRGPNSIKPVTEPEQAAINQGREYSQRLRGFEDRAPFTIDRVDRVLQTVNAIESDRTFQAGKAGELEGRLRAALGDAEYKLLQKEIADLVIETSQAAGTGTDANTRLVAESTGSVEYPPGVLKNVVTKLRGDAFGAQMQAKGAQAFINNGFGEANLRNYRDAWNANADPRVFEAMAIFSSDRLSPDQKKKAFDKIKPTDLQSLDAFERKYKNLQSLSQTGALPPRKP
jgi:hypothetical protein